VKRENDVEINLNYINYMFT